MIFFPIFASFGFSALAYTSPWTLLSIWNSLQTPAIKLLVEFQTWMKWHHRAAVMGVSILWRTFILLLLRKLLLPVSHLFLPVYLLDEKQCFTRSKLRTIFRVLPAISHGFQVLRRPLIHKNSRYCRDLLKPSVDSWNEKKWIESSDKKFLR